MTYFYTQINQYLSCPRRYRHRYLDGWQEKDTRSGMLFGRAFEQLNQSDLVETVLVRKPGVDLGLFDELSF